MNMLPCEPDVFDDCGPDCDPNPYDCDPDILGCDPTGGEPTDPYPIGTF